MFAALHELGGCPRVLLYDNLKAAVVERLADRVRFNAKLLELSAHYHFQPQACTPGRPNEKERVERSIRFIREGFFEARPFTNLEDFNEKALRWRDTVLYRPHPELKPQRVLDVFDEEKTKLLPLPEHRFEAELLRPIHSRKSIYIRFDLNDYSIPHTAANKNLILAASDTRVRILEGKEVIATHQRSYDRGEVVEDPAHKKALLKLRRRAQSSSAMQQLTAQIPEGRALPPRRLRQG